MKTFGKIMCVVLVLALLSGGVAALYYFTDGFKKWLPDSSFTDKNGEQLSTNKVYALQDIVATSDTVQDTVTLQATISPIEATIKELTWELRWKKAQSAFANGKAVTDYVSIQVNQTDSTKVTVKCLKAFGEQIILKATAVSNKNATAEATIDYARRILDIAAINSDNTSEYFLNFGEDEIVLDMVVPTNYDNFKVQKSNKTIWNDKVSFLYHDYNVDENGNDSQFDVVEQKTYKFSDYTIRDCRILSVEVSYEDETIIKRTSNIKLNQEFEKIFEDFWLEVTEGRPFIIDQKRLLYTNNPINFFIDALPPVGFFKCNNDIYLKYTKRIIDWIKANPNEPLFTEEITLQGKYSSFTKTIKFRYNPATAILPVENVDIDNGIVF